MKPQPEKPTKTVPPDGDTIPDKSRARTSSTKNGGRQMGELRRLLVGSEGISDLLPEAVVKSSKSGPELANATLPIVEENIKESVIRDPKTLTEALFPVIGPAIRRAITASLNSMVQSFNQILEHSVSPKGLRWRLEAMRTGRSFGEVVLLKTLLYRVEQVFLIHRETGILLEHVSQNPQDVEDKDMVSGMLTAITDFARDSFDTGDDSTLDSFKISGLSVWVESGPKAYLAGVIRGNPPLDLRDTFSNTIEEIHYRLENEFVRFSGETDIFASAHPLLEECLISQTREPEEEKKRSITPGHFIFGFLILAILAVVGYFAWDYWRWSGLLEDVRNEPGYVLTDQSRGWMRHRVAGLRDPLAGDPAILLKRNNYDSDDVELSWREFHDTDPKFVLSRATKILQPPEDVTLGFREGTLTVSGDATADWAENAIRTGPLLAGVNEVKFAGGAKTLISKIENSKLLFECGSTRLASESAIEAIALDFQKLAVFGSYKVDIVGYADKTGSLETNRFISIERASVVGRAIAKELQGAAANIVFNETAEETAGDECKVTFRVTPLDK